MIPYGKHFIDDDDIAAVIEVLKSSNLTQGPAVDKFEQDIANFVGAKYAVAVSSATAGLFLSTNALSAESIDTSFYTSPITFVASSNAALYCGLKPIFIDVEEDTVNICPLQLQEKISTDSNKVKIIMPVHFAGLPCKMDKISKIASNSGAVIIEDAAHALGAKYECGSMVGSCKYSTFTVFSFHPVKNISTGEGGVITTNDQDLYLKLLRLRSHGINKLDDGMLNIKRAYTDGEINPWYYEMQELGFHFRITDIQAALGSSQLKKLPLFHARRKEIVQKYHNLFAKNKYVSISQPNSIEQSAHHLFVALIDFDKAGISRAKLMKALKEKNILTQVHYIPVVLNPYYENLGYSIDQFPNSNSFYKSALSLPNYFSLSDKEQEYVISSIENILRC